MANANPVGFLADFRARLNEALPDSWTADVDPVRDGVLSGPAEMFAWAYRMIAYTKVQTRLATARDIFLDLFAVDYFGPHGLLRKTGEIDDAYRLRIANALLVPRGTRPAMVNALTRLTGKAPVIFEPHNAADTGGYGAADGVWRNLAYGMAGGYGGVATTERPFQAFITAYRPTAFGVPSVTGYGGPSGGYGAGLIMWGGGAAKGGSVTDADIYAEVAKTMPVAAIGWTQIAQTSASLFPSLTLDFRAAPVAGLTCTRAGLGATYFDSTGTLQVATTGTPRYDYGPSGGTSALGLLVEESRTNAVRNPRMEGATIATGVELTTNGTFALNPLNAAQNTQLNGWQWSVGGTATVTWSNPSVTLTGDGTNFATLTTPISTVSGQVYVISLDVSGAPVFVGAGNSLGSSAVSSLTTVIGTGQLMGFLATSATTWIEIQTSSVTASSIANLSMQFAGTPPTQTGTWNGGASGLARTIIGSGTENGVPYLDLWVRGTTNSAGNYAIALEQNNAGVAAVTGQTWTGSVYVKLTAGTQANFSFKFAQQECNGSGTALSTTFGPAITLGLSGTRLGTQRQTYTVATTQATTAFVMPYLNFSFLSGAVINATLRIGGTQMEQSGTVSSVILPVVGTHTATTRAADTIGYSTAGTWFLPNAAGTLLTEAMLPTMPIAAITTTSWLSALTDGTSQNVLGSSISAGSTFVQASATLLGTGVTVNGASGSLLSGSNLVFKNAIALDGGNLRQSTNGGAVVLTTFPAFPLNLSLDIGGNRALTNRLNGYIRKITYWPRALSNSEMTSAST